MLENQKVYLSYVGEKASQLDRQLQFQIWEQCYRTNSSYLDCPILQYNLYDNYRMYVMVHNPSPIIQSHAIIKVPHEQFNVELFDQELGEYV